MAFTGLSAITEATYRTGQFTEKPNAYREDSPDDRVLPELGGWMATANNEMYLKLTVYPNAECKVNISPVDNSLVVNVSRTNRPSFDTSFWKVNTGVDNKASDWQIYFIVYNDDMSPDEQYTGKWKFTKSKSSEDDTV